MTLGQYRDAVAPPAREHVHARPSSEERGDVAGEVLAKNDGLEALPKVDIYRCRHFTRRNFASNDNDAKFPLVAFQVRCTSHGRRLRIMMLRKGFDGFVDHLPSAALARRTEQLVG